MNPLLEVVTLVEAARLWGKHPNTVRLARDRGKLEARKTGRDWIVTVASCRRYWGEPRTAVTSLLAK